MKSSASSHLLLALVVGSASLVVLLAAAAAADSRLAQDQVADQPAPAGRESARSRFSLPKLFDFEQYKRLFKKTYHSLAEEMVRRKLMLARAFRAWISAIKYKYRRSSFYLAINHMSDWTPAEVDSMQNKVLLAREGAATTMAGRLGASAPEPSSVLPDVDPARIEQDLAKLASDAKFAKLVDGGALSSDDSSGLQRSTRRRKREASRAPWSKLVTRALSMDRLINGAQEVNLVPDSLVAVQRVDLHPVSNNPDYKPPKLAAHGSLHGLARDDNLEEISYVEYNDQTAEAAAAPRPSALELVSSLEDSLARPPAADGPTTTSGGSGGGGLGLEQQADEVYFDHRRSGCLFQPREQGKCGACYAFVATAIAEWFHCVTTGSLVAFSEQYMVDCGQPVGNRGCTGGCDHYSVKFFHNYGVELRQSYPYRARESRCPYDESTHPKEMGYLRMDLKSYLTIPVSKFDQYIGFAPISVAVEGRTFAGFLEYGGGVLLGENCQRRGDHAVLVVGHGREDGLDYWLIRNSWSTSWGEAGYFKLAKRTADQCLEEGTGILYGTENGRNFTTRPEHNALRKRVAFNQE